MRASATKSEEWFERYLVETGHSGAEMPEPDLGVPARPDYVIEKGGARAVVEVKEFSATSKYELAKRAALDRGEPFDAEAAEVFASTRGAIKRGARQLRPLAGRGLPLLVVLANPNGADVKLDAERLGWALYGDPTLAYDKDIRTGEVHIRSLFLGDNGRLSDNHRYLSAIAVLDMRQRATDFFDDWLAEHGALYPNRGLAFGPAVDAMRAIGPPAGQYPRVRVFHTRTSIEGEAVPLPERLFDGPKDEHWHPNEAGQFSRSR